MDVICSHFFGSVKSGKRSRHGFDHRRREEPLVDPPTLVVRTPLSVAVFQAVLAKVPYLDRLFLRVHVHRHIAGHVHLRGLPNQDLKQVVDNGQLRSMERYVILKEKVISESHSSLF